MDLKKDPKIIKKRSENDTEKQTRKKGVKRDQNGARRAPPGSLSGGAGLDAGVDARGVLNHRSPKSKVPV